jgi:phiEco32-like amidoligase-type 2 protein
MDINEVPIGATFSFEPKSEAALNEQIRTVYSWHTSIEKLLVPSDSKYRLLSPPQNEGNFRLEMVGLGSQAYSYQPPFSSLKKLTGIKVRNVEMPTSIRELPSRDPFSTSCDPELFLENGKGEIIPAFEVLPDAEHKIEVDTPEDYHSDLKGAFYADGFGAEFSPAPYQCHAVVNHRMAGIIKKILKHVRKTNTDVSISPKNFVEIPAEIMARGTDAQVALGCQPSENIYGTPNFAPGNSRAFPYRMVGGHIHLGDKLIAPWLHKRAEPIIRAMDAFCGVPTVAMFDGIDDPRRRQYYGRAGEFRFQPHGLEYRALSNAWLSHPMFSHLVMNLARASFRLGFLNWQEIHKVDAMRVQYIIDNYDVKEARKFVEEYKLLLTFLMEKDGGESYPTAKAFQLFEVGVKTALPNWDDFEGNWSKHKSVGAEEGGHASCVSTWRYGSERVLFRTREEIKAMEKPEPVPVPMPVAPAGALGAWAQQFDAPLNAFGQDLRNVPMADENAPPPPLVAFNRPINVVETAEQRRDRLAMRREHAIRNHRVAVERILGQLPEQAPAPPVLNNARAHRAAVRAADPAVAERRVRVVGNPNPVIRRRPA